MDLREFDSDGNATITTPANQTDVCTQALANLTDHYALANSTLLSLLVNARLGNMKWAPTLLPAACCLLPAACCLLPAAC